MARFRGLDFKVPSIANGSPSGRSFISRLCLLLLGYMTISAGTVLAKKKGQSSNYIPKLSSYLQIRYTAPGTGEDRFSLRRFKLILDGGPADKLHYHLQFIYKVNNGSATDDRVFLQDAHIVYPFGSALSLKAGQFIPPFGLERFQPDYELDFVGRTEATKRLVVDGNLGDSFARDYGLQGDWDKGGWKISTAIFQGAGANNPLRGNGPLAVARLCFGRKGSRQGRRWLWRAGLAGSDRRDADQNFSGQLPGLGKNLTSHFRGRDSRLNAFVQADRGPLRTQAELFRAWFEPDSGSEIAAAGAYGQLAYLPAKRVILGLRYQWFNPDVNTPSAPSLKQWTAAATYDWQRLPLRIATGYSWGRNGTGPSTVWRVQLQYFIVKKLSLRPLVP